MLEVERLANSSVQAEAAKVNPAEADWVSRYLHSRSGQLAKQDISLIVLGDAGVGKSTLLNALLGRDAAQVGFGHQTTATIGRYRLSSAAGDLLLYDTPGLGSHHDRGEDKQTLARVERLLPQCDLVLVVIDAVSRQHHNVARLYRNYLCRRDCLHKVIFVLSRCDAIPSLAGPEGGKWDERYNCPDSRLNRTIHSLIQHLQGQQILAVDALPEALPPPTFIAVSATRRWNLVSLLKLSLDACQTASAKLNLLLQTQAAFRGDLRPPAALQSGAEAQSYTLESLIEEMHHLFGEDVGRLFGER